MFKSMRTNGVTPWKKFGGVMTCPTGSLQIAFGQNEDGERFNPHLFMMPNGTAMSDVPCRLSSTYCLTPCGEEQDEKLLFIAMPNNGGEQRLVDTELLTYGVDGSVLYAVVRVEKSGGHLAVCANGVADIFSWKGDYMRLPLSAYDKAVAADVLFSVQDWEEADMAVCRAKCAAWEARQNAAIALVAANSMDCIDADASQKDEDETN